MRQLAARSAQSSKQAKTPEADKSGSQRSQGHRFDHSSEAIPLPISGNFEDAPSSGSDVRTFESYSWPGALTGPATMPSGLQGN